MRHFKNALFCTIHDRVTCPHCVPSGQRVLAAVNPQGPDVTLDVEILDTALGIACLLGRPLHVVHAWQAHGVHLLAPRIGVEELARYVRVTRQWHRRLCDALLCRYAGVIPRDRLHLCKGPPADTIVAVAAELDADPIVIGTVARRGVARLLFGNTAERVMRRTERAVVMVKPGELTSSERPARTPSLPRATIARRPRRFRRSTRFTPSRAPVTG